MEKENREIEVGYGSNDKGEMVFGLSVGDYTLSNLSPVETKQIYECLRDFGGLFNESDEKSTDVDVSDLINSDYMQTINMESDEEIEQWENDNSGCVVFDDMERRMELYKLEWLHGVEETNELIPTDNEFLNVAVCDDVCEAEVLLTFSSMGDIRKLRDYLNNYLENNFEKK